MKEKIALEYATVAWLADNLDLLIDYMGLDGEPKRQGPEEHDAHRAHMAEIERMAKSLRWMLREEMNLGHGGAA